MYNSNVFELKIVENFQLIENEDFEAFESEDTLSILNRYVEESEIDLEKSTIQDIIKDVYQEACEVSLMHIITIDGKEDAWSILCSK